MSELPETQRYLMNMQMRTPLEARPGANMCSPRNHTGLSLFRRLSLQSECASFPAERLSFPKFLPSALNPALHWDARELCIRKSLFYAVTSPALTSDISRLND